MAHNTSSLPRTAPWTSTEAGSKAGIAKAVTGSGSGESPAPFLFADREMRPPGGDICSAANCQADDRTPQALSDAPRPQAKRGVQSLTLAERQERRREQCRLAKQRQRSKGDVKKEIILTPMEELELLACMSMQRGPEAGFLRRALLTGAKFLANAGNAADTKAAIADMSASAH